MIETGEGKGERGEKREERIKGVRGKVQVRGAKEEIKETRKEKEGN